MHNLWKNGVKITLLFQLKFYPQFTHSIENQTTNSRDSPQGTLSITFWNLKRVKVVPGCIVGQNQ
ncbi:unnamed protein product (macronuclear) [Paramecium tetraurelia]|uniref:Uncharacterized protein n=1 Tax=Paramecium tetraurelia TaxID=5888 RepID=A0CPF3_PARTE|nr:uncharacterized protein GSPATT00009061001 [Paramecium tetraurelia]CAK72670.1 unnamed protein product [Paramecium tetraurelia]|eukprot:XP_001440067.1 hypothetical protein (macronuclear) [Paramecium tetraurelia strain d4-2]